VNEWVGVGGGGQQGEGCGCDGCVDRPGLLGWYVARRGRLFDVWVCVVCLVRRVGRS
jgi:hypothetical protein